MTTIIENIQDRFIKLFISLMIIETIVRFTFCLSFTNKIYALSLAGILAVFAAISILYLKKALKPHYTINLILCFYFLIHFVYVMGTFKFIPAMLLWFLVIPLATRIYYSSKISIIVSIVITFSIVFMTQIPFSANISNHYKEIVLDYYGASTAEFVVNFFIIIIFSLLILTIYYLIQVLKVQYKNAGYETTKPVDISPTSLHKEGDEEDVKESEDIHSTTNTRLFGIYQLIEEYMDTSECYLNPDYTLDQLSEDLKINKITLSISLNRLGRISFKDLLNRYRINKAKEMFDNDIFRSKNIKQIYLTVGFKYHTTFNRVFKKQEGITPSEYIIRLGKTHN